eukprot:229316-Prymnesium_polylepis.3
MVTPSSIVQPYTHTAMRVVTTRVPPAARRVIAELASRDRACAGGARLALWRVCCGCALGWR